MARRGRRLTETALRVAAAILVDTLAFAIWNLGGRSPQRLLRDCTNALARPRVLARGLTSFAVGLVLLLGSLTLLRPLLLPLDAFRVLVIWTVLTGLLVENVVGPSFAGVRPRRDG